MTDLPIAVIGAGLTGSMVALMLAQQGFRVLVIEKRGDPRSQYDAAEVGAKYVTGEAGWSAHFAPAKPKFAVVSQTLAAGPPAPLLFPGTSETLKTL